MENTTKKSPDSRITEKIVKFHYECPCGLNEVEDIPMKITYAMAAKLVMKRRKFKNTGEKFFYCYTRFICDSCLELNNAIFL